MIDFARLIRALLGKPEPVPPPVIQYVDREVIKEVPVEVIKEVIKEVPVEVIKEVDPPATVESITRLLDKMAIDNPTDDVMCRLWYDVDQAAFHALGEIWVNTVQASASQLQQAIYDKYPTLTGLALPDNMYNVTSKESIIKVLMRDWIHRVQYEAEINDCDDFALGLVYHFTHYYKISAFIVWGDVPAGYHAFAMVFAEKDGVVEPFLVEPQSIELFDHDGPLGEYTPRSLVLNYGLIK